MKILVSFSNFKGTLSNEEACNLACDFLQELGHTTTSLPLGDGGKGTFSFLKFEPLIFEKSHSISGAFGDPRMARSWWKKSELGTQQIFLESTDAIGYPPSDPLRRDPMGATSRGLGEWLLLIEKDLQGEPCELFIGLGDSAISDAGKGMLDIFQGRSFPNWNLTVLCDVENPLCGPNGSARVFAPQKGASPSEVLLIEQAHGAFAEEVQKSLGIPIAGMPRAGSAGGLAAALHAFLGGTLVSGSAWVLNAAKFEEALKEHDLLIVGEGKSDAQTLSGKSPWAAIQLAEKLGKKSVLISGSFGEGYEQILSPNLLKKIACGQDPSPEKALIRALTQI